MSMRATLLVGSPRGPKSTSDALGTYLLERLKGKGVGTDKIHIQRALTTERGISSLLSGVREADIIILSSPLYADCHHSGVTAAMELIHRDLRDNPHTKRQMMAAISNSGFPESRHNDTSLAISRRFALECGFHWSGGLALGGGESIGGRPLEKAGRLARNVRKSLELAADALAHGESIPDEAIRLMGQPLMPKWLYLFVGDMGWRWRARKQGCNEKLDCKPNRD